ncbi:MAG: FGGY-family carbohydrate kinase [Pseudomonadota bacterium]
MSVAIGIDVGTSGVRAAAVERDGPVLAMARADHPPQTGAGIDAALWWRAVSDALDALRAAGAPFEDVTHICVDGTSGTLALVDAALAPVAPALMYNSSGFVAEAERIGHVAEPVSIARGQNSALARLLRLQTMDGERAATHALTQCDYILAKLAGCAIGSDANNVLKLGYDPATGTWPGWFEEAGVRMDLLPVVHLPGTEIASVAPDMAERFGLSTKTVLAAGTTDSIAAFLAAGVTTPGGAVTSLGSTLAVKLLSATRVDDPDRGVYSHRLGDMWLAGGASNTGGAVLSALLPGADLAALSAGIDPEVETGLDYYPLAKPGERFPINDPELPPRTSPRPEDDTVYLHGLLEGMSQIEAIAYGALAELGATPVSRIVTAGGGATNPVWTAIRQRRIGVPIHVAPESEAAVGAARLAFVR